MDKYKKYRDLSESYARQIGLAAKWNSNEGPTRNFGGLTQEGEKWEARFYKSEIEIRFPDSGLHVMSFDWFLYDLNYLKIIYGEENKNEN